MPKKKSSKLLGKIVPSPSIAPLLGGYRLEIYGEGEGQCLLLSGAKRILSVTEEEVVFALRGARLVLCGAGLVCLTYEGGIAEVSGGVSAIHFETGEVGR